MITSYVAQHPQYRLKRRDPGQWKDRSVAVIKLVKSDAKPIRLSKDELQVYEIYQERVEIEPGGTHEVTLGGSGAVITGRVKTNLPLHSRFHLLTTKTETATLRPPAHFATNAAYKAHYENVYLKKQNAAKRKTRS